MRGTLGRSILTAVGLAASLTGCAAGQLVDQLPSGLGLPADVPARPTTSYQYPPVHDTPPPRATKPMSAEKQLRLEDQLSILRDRQERRTHTQVQATKSTKAAKKKPAKPRNINPTTIESAGAGNKP
jgi:hypothetical protein